MGERTLQIPVDRKQARVRVGDREVRLSNLDKPFWPDLGLTKRDLLQYYADVGPTLLPHLEGRPMVMKRYPDGWRGEHFFMKRTPSGAPEWLERCRIEHRSGNVIDFPVLRDVASLLWMVNLGCIDLNPWYGRCPRPAVPDRMVLDLDPVPPAGFEQVRKVALLARDRLREIGMTPYAKTSGSRGIHVHAPIVEGPAQKEVWRVAKGFATLMEERHPAEVTARYRIRDRPAGRVLVDYNQNAWGRTLASVYSIRPREGAPVSMPVGWEEVEAGVRTEDFRLENARARLERTGDLWAPMLAPASERFDLRPLLDAGATPGGAEGAAGPAEGETSDSVRSPA